MEESLLSSEVQYRSYYSRWWICLIFSLLSLGQSCIWITYSVIATPTVEYYHTTYTAVNFLVALAAIVYIPVVFVSSWFTEKFGLRLITVLGAILCAVGSSIRLLAVKPGLFWIVILGQGINGIAGPIVMSIPPKISAAWFPPEERVTATAIMALSNFGGSMVGFLIGIVVKTPDQIPHLLYVQAACSIFLLVCIVIYFPSNPPTPPSPSALITQKSEQHHEMTFLESLKLLCLNKDFVLLCMVGGLSAGVMSGWSTLLDVMLTPLGFTQEQAAWLGFSSTSAAIASGILLGRVADKYARNYKLFMIVTFMASTISFALFTLQVLHWIPYNFWMLMLVAIFAVVFLNCSNPLFYEMCVEVTYPVPEATTGGMLTLMNNVGTLIFIFAADYIDPITMNWITTGSVAFLGGWLFLLKEQYKRNDIDVKYAIN